MMPKLRALSAAAVAAATIFAAAGAPMPAAATGGCPTGPTNGDVEVASNTICILTTSTPVKGDVTVDDHGVLELEGASISGDVYVEYGGALLSDYAVSTYLGSGGANGTYQDTGKRSSVGGSIQYNYEELPGTVPVVLILINTSVGKGVTVGSGSNLYQLAICGSNISGGLNLYDVEPTMGAFVGDPPQTSTENNQIQFDSHCAGNKISGGMHASEVNDIAIEGNQINGGLTVYGGSDDVEVDGNTITGGTTLCGLGPYDEDFNV